MLTIIEEHNDAHNQERRVDNGIEGREGRKEKPATRLLDGLEGIVLWRRESNIPDAYFENDWSPFSGVVPVRFVPPSQRLYFNLRRHHLCFCPLESCQLSRLQTRPESFLLSRSIPSPLATYLVFLLPPSALHHDIFVRYRGPRAAAAAAASAAPATLVVLVHTYMAIPTTYLEF